MASEDEDEEVGFGRSRGCSKPKFGGIWNCWFDMSIGLIKGGDDKNGASPGSESVGNFNPPVVVATDGTRGWP